MRHASQLCRGLAEASRSLERPYVPRHVPLPSSSYSASAQGSTTPTPTAPKKPSSNRGSNKDDKLSKDAIPTSSAQQYSVQRLSRSSLAQVGTKHPSSHRKAVNLSTTDPPQLGGTSASSPKKENSLKASLPDADDIWTSRRQSVRSHESGTPSRLREAFNASAAPTGSMLSRTNDATHKGTKSTHFTSAQRIDCLLLSYPGMTKPQASLLLQTFRRTQSSRSRAPRTVLAWYEDLVWTTERQEQGSERIESSQSLSLLLRYAYQRNDLRSLLRIESRARRVISTIRQPLNATPASSLLPKELGNTEVDGVCIWPEPNEDPLPLSYNLKVAFAAREGNWVKVDELLNQSNHPPVRSSMTPGMPRNAIFANRSESALGAIGWGSLLRFGLGSVRSLNVQDPSSLTAPEKAPQDQSTNSAPATGSGTTTESLTKVVEDEAIRKAKENQTQTQAKLTVTKRLLPYLLRYTSAPQHISQPAGSAQGTTTSSTEPTTPVWLLQSVLTQLAERGETASTIRIVQLALSEKCALDQRALVRGGTTNILNLALVACVQNHTVNLTETLRIFNNLTGSHLGVSFTGTAVLAQPNLADAGEGGLQSKPTAKQDGAGREMGLEGSNGSSTGVNRIVPNEESLVLVLKKVRHPLFRASWARKLVEEFQQLFPMVKLSGRTFRMIIDKCVVPTPGTPSEPAPLPESVQAARPTEHIVASGRRGRRLRQQAAANAIDAPAPTSSDRTIKLSERRGPIIKQSILAQTLADILIRFDPARSSLLLHLSTTNRRRFEHTLLRAKRTLLAKKEYHQEKIRGNADDEGFVRHHTSAIHEIERLIELIGQVQRLGRSEEARKKKKEIMKM